MTRSYLAAVMGYVKKNGTCICIDGDAADHLAYEPREMLDLEVIKHETVNEERFLYHTPMATPNNMPVRNREHTRAFPSNDFVKWGWEKS